MSRTRPKRKDLIEWFNPYEGEIVTVRLKELDSGYYAFGPRGNPELSRVAIGPLVNQADLADYLNDVEGAAEGEGVGIVMNGRVVAWRDVVPSYSWPALDMIPEHLVR